MNPTPITTPAAGLGSGVGLNLAPMNVRMDGAYGLGFTLMGLILVGVSVVMAGRSHKGKVKEQANSLASVALSMVPLAIGATIGAIGLTALFGGFLKTIFG